MSKNSGNDTLTNNFTTKLYKLQSFADIMKRMRPKKPNPLSEAARAMGKKGGRRTLQLHGPEHFSKASKSRKSKSGWPKGRPRKPKKGGK
jgi:hypothetical protein